MSKETHTSGTEVSPVYIGDYVFDPAKQILFDAVGEMVALTGKSRQMLTLLANKPGQTVPRPTIITKLWPNAPDANSQISACIEMIRTALNDTQHSFLRSDAQGYSLHPTSQEHPDTRRRPWAIFATLAGVAVLAAVALAIL